MILSRTAGEDKDNSGRRGQLPVAAAEAPSAGTDVQNLPRVAVVLNTGGIPGHELGGGLPARRCAVLWQGRPGVGGLSAADVLLGYRAPSGEAD